jgi:hypothetical protein
MSKANEVCGKYYKDKCHVCPLRTECCKRIGPGREKLDSWQAEVEEAAEEIMSSTQTDYIVN